MHIPKTNIKSFCTRVIWDRGKVKMSIIGNLSRTIDYWLFSVFVDEIYQIYTTSEESGCKKWFVIDGELYYKSIAPQIEGSGWTKTVFLPNTSSGLVRVCVSLLNKVFNEINIRHQHKVLECRNSSLIYHSGIVKSNADMQKWEKILKCSVNLLCFNGIYSPYGWEEVINGERVITGNESYLNELIGKPYTISKFEEVMSDRILHFFKNGSFKWFICDKIIINGDGTSFYAI
jgi:hypothetical protein